MTSIWFKMNLFFFYIHYCKSKLSILITFLCLFTIYRYIWNSWFLIRSSCSRFFSYNRCRCGSRFFSYNWCRCGSRFFSYNWSSSSSRLFSYNWINSGRNFSLNRLFYNFLSWINKLVIILWVCLILNIKENKYTYCILSRSITSRL
jgi:hypothetical protein